MAAWCESKILTCKIETKLSIELFTMHQTFVNYYDPKSNFTVETLRFARLFKKIVMNYISMKFGWQFFYDEEWVLLINYLPKQSDLVLHRLNAQFDGNTIKM